MTTVERGNELFVQFLAPVTAESVAAGVTLWGIHKDDVVLSLNDREARLYASQGQQRSIMLSMKLALASSMGSPSRNHL